jgi:hypothetical protein
MLVEQSHSPHESQKAEGMLEKTRDKANSRTQPQWFTSSNQALPLKISSISQDNHISKGSYIKQMCQWRIIYIQTIAKMVVMNQKHLQLTPTPTTMSVNIWIEQEQQKK